MSDTKEKTALIKGGEFITKETDFNEIFIPEDASEEQLMIREMTQDFLRKEITPVRDQIEKQVEGLTPRLMEKMGELGLLSTNMPEQYGGMELDDNTNTIIADAFGPAGSFTVPYAAHTGIGMLPILYFGTDKQKEKYLPRLMTGELKSAYCLTEPNAGSDALASKTVATLTADGKHYILNGQKMWISNASFADLFIVFAKIDGKKFTGFLVEKGTEGLTLGAEENKLGIKGSSTRQVYFENVKIPVGNLLGEAGKGHKIAFNALNIGRFKLSAMATGGAKVNASTAIQYANERKQFGVTIGTFGAIKYKLAEQAIRIFASESALYRTSDLLGKKKKELEAEGLSYGQAKLKAAEEYAIECALLKVSGSEALDYVVDETVQIHGGMGYSEEGTAARAYRDARINRIFEGTNEINRLLSVDMLLKRALKGRIDIVGPAWAVQKELASMPGFDQPEGDYGYELKAIKDFKKIILMVAGGASKMQMDGQLNLQDEQEVLMNVSDMMIDLFQAESMLMRVMKLATKDDKKINQAIYDAMVKVFIYDVNAKMNKYATDALASFAEGDLLKTFLMGLKRFTKYPPVNVKALRRSVADTLLEANEYCF